MGWLLSFWSKLLYTCFFNFSVLISNSVNIKRYNPHDQKLFRVLNDFEDCKGILRPKSLGTAALPPTWGTWVPHSSVPHPCRCSGTEDPWATGTLKSGGFGRNYLDHVIGVPGGISHQDFLLLGYRKNKQLWREGMMVPWCLGLREEEWEGKIDN